MLPDPICIFESWLFVIRAVWFILLIFAIFHYMQDDYISIENYHRSYILEYGLKYYPNEYLMLQYELTRKHPIPTMTVK